MSCKTLFIVLFSASTALLFGDPWAPDFIIIGAPKSGSTTLYQNLLKHPNISGPYHEPHFFSNHFQQGDLLWSSENDWSWYQEQFPVLKDNQFVIGEKSADYLSSSKAPARILSCCPKVKLIAILRNPIDAAYSFYWMRVRVKGIEGLSFEDLFNDYLNGDSKDVWMFSVYTYSRHLKRWFDLFPREQMLILFFDDLEKDQMNTINSAVSFLDLPDFEQPEPKIYNQFKQTYPPMDPNIRQRLAEFYAPFNRELEELLGVELNWN